LPVVCIETRRMKVFASASPVKTDRKDAQAIAQAMRMGFFRAVHMKTRASLEARLVLTNRSLLLRQRLQIQNTIRGTLKGFGVKLGAASQGRFVGKVRALIAENPILQAAIEPLLEAWQALRRAFLLLDRQVRRAAWADPVCRLLMTAPGVGAVVALAFRTGIDDVNRFAKSRLVGAHLGLTPRKYASGRIDRDGRITKCGDAMVRGYLFEAANSILSRLKKPCALRDWALELAQRTSAKHAKVALARRLAIILHRMWLTGEAFRWSPAAAS
jgi:transposase